MGDKNRKSGWFGLLKKLPLCVLPLLCALCDAKLYGYQVLKK
jgi:hypothetical protein